MIKKLLCVFIFTLFAAKGMAQDMQFTQFFAAPTYLNPAFTGANACSRIATSYRNQWPGVPGAFVSYALSYDHYLSEINSGLGFLFTRDKAGSGQLRSTGYNFLYAYEAQLTRKLVARAGVQAGFNFRSVNFYDLVFGDQIARGGAALTVEDPTRGRVFFFDASSGLLLYTKKYWGGFSVHHLNEPNEALVNNEGKLPRKYSLHGGRKFILPNPSGDETKAEQSISPAINYKAQEKFDQVDIGMYYERAPLILGLWYRGIPGLKAYKDGYSNNDAVAFLAGFTKDRLRIGYSYDYTISKLTIASHGAHEISLIYQFCKLSKKKPRKRLIIPCPKF